MLRELLPRRVRRALGKVRGAAISRLLAARAKRRLEDPKAGRPHLLPRELIVSLTSYPARFPTLHLTLACLLDQTVQADRTILWIAKQDIKALPASVRRFEHRGLEIRACEDLRAFKKLIPALEVFPEAFVATADDDLYFSRRWLQQLVEATRTAPRVVTSHRVHRFKRESSGKLAPYLDWDFDVRDRRARRPSCDIVPTGGAGALYPPHCLDRCVTNRLLFERLCPMGDDLWFYWCARLAGTLHQKVAGNIWPVNWESSQQSSLWESNEGGGNDAAIDALEREFGYLS